MSTPYLALANNNIRDLDGTAQPLVCGQFEVFIGVDCIQPFRKARILDRKEGFCLRAIFRSLVGGYRADLRVVVRRPLSRLVASETDVKDS